MSTAPLQEYFDCLNTFGSSVCEKVDKSTGHDLEKVKGLIEQGCLSAVDATTNSGKAFINVSLTPQGSVVLAEWAGLLRANSFRGQVMATLGKIIWLFVGMLITLSGALFLKIIE